MHNNVANYIIDTIKSIIRPKLTKCGWIIFRIYNLFLNNSSLKLFLNVVNEGGEDREGHYEEVRYHSS